MMATAKQLTNKDERGVPRATVTTLHFILPQVFVGETLSPVEVIRSEEGMQVPNGCHYALDTQKKQIGKVHLSTSRAHFSVTLPYDQVNWTSCQP